jgi:hypothetical protein
MKELTTRDITFYVINALCTWIDDDESSYTEILSNGLSFICPLSKHDVEDVIEESLTNTLKI